MRTNAYTQLMQYKTWADRGLYRVVAENRHRLEAGDQAIMMQVLDHIFVVDQIFQHNLCGRAHGYRAARSAEPLQFELLADEARKLDEWYSAYVEGLSEDALNERVSFAFANGTQTKMRRADIIMHVALHGTYHRGNAGVILQKNGIKPNDDRVTDFLAA